MALAVWPAVVAAQGVPDPEALVREGVALRAQHRDAEALDRFTRAYETAPSPRARVQMAWAAQALGRWMEAERWLDEGLQHPTDPWVARNRAAIDASRAAIAAHLGNLEVLCPVAGARLEVDGVDAGPLPLRAPLRIAAGTVVLRVSAEGFVPATREGVVVQPASLTRETISLAPVPAPVVPPPAAATAPAPSPAVVPAPTPTTVPVATTRPVQAVLGWTSFGVGLAVTAVGAATLIDRESTVDDYVARFNANTCTGTTVPDTDPTCQSLRASADRALPLGVGLAIGGGVVAGVGLALALTAPSTRPSTTALRCAPALGMTGVGCTLRF